MHWLSGFIKILRDFFTKEDTLIRVRLERNAYTPLGTFGILRVGDKWWYTVEEIWKGNQVGISCIPTGRYRMIQAKHGWSTGNPYDCYQLVGVPGRDLINVHIANTISDIEGCIGPGKAFGCIRDRKTDQYLPAVLSSAVAFREFMESMGGVDEAEIEIVDRVPVDWSKMN